jgi:hypothetical protein
VDFDVEGPPPPPVALNLTLVSSDVVIGEAASFAVSVRGGGAVPAYVLSAGDGSADETRSEATFTHVFQRAGRFSVSVRPPPGAVGTGAVVRVTVSGPTRIWMYAAAAALFALVGAYVVLRVMRRSRRPAKPTIVTLHPRQRMPPRFNPDTPPGVSLEVRFVKNLAGMRFTPRVRLDGGS